MLRPLKSTDMIYVTFPLVLWSKENGGLEKRVVLRHVKTSSPPMYQVDMHRPDGRLDFTAKLSRGYIEKFYFVKE